MKKLLSTFIFIILFGGFMLSIKTKIVQAESVETKNVINVYCIECLAEVLEVSTQDILDKIEEFKDEGCKLFE